MVEEEDKDTDSERRAGRLMRAEELFRRVVELMDMDNIQTMMISEQLEL